jgi:hypothetical protein
MSPVGGASSLAAFSESDIDVKISQVRLNRFEHTLSVNHRSDGNDPPLNAIDDSIAIDKTLS